MGECRNTAIVLAAGQGKRMHSKIQKQFMELDGMPVLCYSLRCFQESPLIRDVILVTGEEYVSWCREEIVKKYGTMLYDFVWGDLCDWYLELSKPVLRGDEGEERKRAVQSVLSHVFRRVLLLLHPFIPFVTEELWHTFEFGEASIETVSWPVPEEGLLFADSLGEMDLFQETVRVLRNLRAEAHIPPQTTVNRAIVQTEEDSPLAAVLRVNAPMIEGLVKIRSLTLLPPGGEKIPGALSSQLSGGEANLIVGDILDLPSEIERLEKEALAVEMNLSASESRLSNPSFVARAPEEVVEKEKTRLEETRARIARIRENIESLRRS